jgi:hypothetical protein
MTQPYDLIRREQSCTELVCLSLFQLSYAFGITLLTAGLEPATYWLYEVSVQYTAAKLEFRRE